MRPIVREWRVGDLEVANFANAADSQLEYCIVLGVPPSSKARSFGRGVALPINGHTIVLRPEHTSNNNSIGHQVLVRPHENGV